MKLVRFGQPGKEKPGLIDAEGKIRDLSGVIPDLAGEYLTHKYLDKLARMRVSALPMVRGKPRLGSPVARPGHFVAVGLNYIDHAKEAGLPIPEEPVLFDKAANCISGPNDPVMMPRDGLKLDWEVELGIVIGERASYVTERAALKHVAGFCLANDVSERAFQLERGGNWVKGKSAPTFGPLGPWLVTPDEIPNVQRLKLWLDVNGQKRQRGSTKTMIFSVRKIVSYISNFMTLDPGDVIITGTPSGVALGMKPQRWLKPGDIVTLGADYLGEQTQEIVEFKPSK